jgi:predicted nucleotide-binding protein (sugar kinase/HSP70/actin superfamily)
MVTVGIPRALSYYRYFPFWKSLLEGLGTEVVVSKHTGKHLLEDGVRHCVDDICVPVKLFYGHVLDLADRVDYLFISRLVSVEKSESDTYTCPKLIGLPDMIKSSLSGLPPIIDFVVDVQNMPLKSSAKKLADSFGITGARVGRALDAALEVERRYQAELLRGVPPEEAIDVVLSNGGGNGSGSKAGPRRTGSGDLNIALVGHEYLIFEPFISHNMPRKLERLGANVSFITQVPSAVVDRELSRYPGISWSYEKELLGAASHFLSRDDIDGVMLVVGFACGPDSIINEIITREVRTEKSPPLMTLVLDEHTGEAGVATRVEAFVDLVRRSRSRTPAREPEPNR